jgi:hypothetical protein
MVVDNTGSLYVLSSVNHGVWRYDAVQGWVNVFPGGITSIGLDTTGALVAH